MKKLMKDTLGVAPLVIVGIVALLLIVVYMFAGQVAVVPTAEVVSPVGLQSGDITLSLTNKVGTSVGTDATITVYLTSPDVYSDVYDGWAAIDEEGGLVSPYDASKEAGAKTATPTTGDVTFSITATKYDVSDPENYPGTDFGVFIKDAGVLVGDYASELGKIKVNSRLNLDETTITTIVEGLDGYFGSDIELAPMGNISYYDPQAGNDNQATYVINPAANASITDADFDLTVRLNSDNSELRDVGVYIDEVDSFAGTALLTLDDVEVWVNNAKLSGTSLTKVADLESGSAAKKNAPTASATGTSTMWYVENGEFDITRTNANNLDVVTIKIVDYDYDLSAAGTSDQCKIIVHCVANNGHKDSDMATDDFFIDMEFSSGGEGVYYELRKDADEGFDDYYGGLLF